MRPRRESLTIVPTAGGGLLPATLLPIVPTQVGLEFRLSPATGAALIVAGLISVLVFPALTLAPLRGASTADQALPSHPTMEHIR